MNSAASEHPEAKQPRLLLARYYIGEGEPEKVPLAVLGDLQHDFNDPQVLSVLGQSQLATKSLDARRTLQRLVELQPKSPQAHFLLSQANSQSGDTQETETELKKALELDAKQFPARLALTRLQLLKDNLADAKENMNLLKAQAPDNPDVLLLEGDILRASGQQKQALDLYENVFGQSANTTTMLAVSQQKWKMGDKEGALAIQKQWVDDHPEDLSARLALANSYTALKRTDDAVKQYTDILKSSENNPIVLNNLAWTLLDTNPKQALEYATKASEATPESAATADTMAMALLKNGKTELALRKSERAMAYSPKDPSIRYHNAMIQEAAGYETKAITTLMDLLKENHDFPERADANRLLKRLQSGG